MNSQARSAQTPPARWPCRGAARRKAGRTPGRCRRLPNDPAGTSWTWRIDPVEDAPDAGQVVARSPPPAWRSCGTSCSLRCGGCRGSPVACSGSREAASGSAGLEVVAGGRVELSTRPGRCPSKYWLSFLTAWAKLLVRPAGAPPRWIRLMELSRIALPLLVRPPAREALGPRRLARAGECGRSGIGPQPVRPVGTRVPGLGGRVIAAGEPPGPVPGPRPPAPCRIWKTTIQAGRLLI